MAFLKDACLKLETFKKERNMGSIVASGSFIDFGQGTDDVKPVFWDIHEETSKGYQHPGD